MCVPSGLPQKADRLKKARRLKRPDAGPSSRCWPAVIFAFTFGFVAHSFGSAPPHVSAQPRMLPPVQPACVASPFGPRILPNKPIAGTFHNGIDIPAPVGSSVAAVAPGTIIRIQRHGIGGLEILIQHDGFVGIYSHLGLIAPVLAEGRKNIYAGERIGRVGRTGLTYGPHLYFGMIVAGRPVDPAPYLQIGLCGSNEQATDDLYVQPTRLLATVDPRHHSAITGRP